MSSTSNISSDGQVDDGSQKGKRAQLPASMEHIRSAVTVIPSIHSPPPASVSETTELSEPADVYGVPTSVIQPIRRPPTAPKVDNPQKRTDPFAFGSRFLEEGDDIFQFNAWDHVTVDDAYGKFAEEMYQKQRDSPVDELDKQRYNEHPERFWNKFYKNNTTNFFKDRKWLQQEFPILKELSNEDSGPATIVEIGAGAGNTAFPIMKLNQNPLLRLHACDFSKTAVEVMKNSEEFTESQRLGKLDVSVWDVASLPDEKTGEASLPEGVKKESIDVVLLVFIFSALSPKQWDRAIRNIWEMLKPGGTVLFRDYGRGDLAQVRFRKGRYLDENFYVRGDGTRVYFFDEEELKLLWTGESVTTATEDHIKEDNTAAVTEAAEALEKLDVKGIEELESSTRPNFVIADFGVDRRMLVNRQRRLKMYRCWMQARFEKPTPSIQLTEEDSKT